MAVEEGRTKIVSMLVKAGAAVDGQNKVGHIFYCSCHGHVQLKPIMKFMPLITLNSISPG